MINHIVLFKLKNYSGNEKSSILVSLKSLLESLKNQIDVLQHLEVGLNYELDAKSYDLALITHFQTLGDLETYRIHPAHQKVLAEFSRYPLDRAAVDFEF